MAAPTPTPRPPDAPRLEPVARPSHPAHPRRSRIGWALVALLTLAAAFLAYRRWYPATAADAALYLTAAVDRGPIEQSVNATGTVNPVKTVQVGTYVSGPIIGIAVDFNSPVRKGQRVAQIDPAPFAVKVREGEANVANARARVEKDKADLALKKLLFERNKTLLGRSLIAQNDVDTAKSNYDQAVAQVALDRAAIEQAQGTLEEAEVNLRYTDILSPVDGVVVSKNVDVGQTVAASFQTPTLFLIAEDLTKMQVDTSVSESDVGRVQEGQPASFTVDAYPGQPFHAHVAQVRNAPVTVQNVVTYDVVVAVDNSELKLKPGMTANVSITTAKREGALRIPLRALRFRPEGARAAASAAAGDRSRGASVYTVADGSLRPVEIQTGVRDAQFVEVTGGELHEGDRVAVGIRREPQTTATPARPPGFAGGRRF